MAFRYLSDGPLRVSIAMEKGGRIASFRYDSTEILSSLRDSANLFWGSTIWPAPQSEWKWPPPRVMDQGTYTLKSRQKKALLIESPENAYKNIKVTKRYSLLDSTTFIGTYVFQNLGDTTVQVGIWENTRVDYAGQVIWETGHQQAPEIQGLMQEDSLSILSLEGHTKSHKIFIVNKSGWVAYQKGAVKLTKRFQYFEPAMIAPGHTQIEVYYDPINQFAEVENHSHYMTLPPGKKSFFEVYWEIERLD